MRGAAVGVGLLVGGCGQGALPSPGAPHVCLPSVAPEGGPDALVLGHVDATRSELARGHVLLTQNSGGESYAVVLDGCANHVWWTPSVGADQRIARALLSADGTRVLVMNKAKDETVGTGSVVEVDPLSAEVVRSTPMANAHHDFRELPGDRVAWLARETLENLWLPEIPADLITDVVRTATLGEQDHQRLFGLYPDMGVDPWFVCNHMNDLDFVPGYSEWAHSNSLTHDPQTGRTTVFARYWDALIALRADGSVEWSIGGPTGEFTFPEGTRWLRHSHLSEVWPGGLLAFDNRNHDGASRIVEFAIDEEARTVTEVWSHELGQFEAFLGDAVRLPGGNVLVAESPRGRLIELTREGEVVWEATLPERTIGRLQFLPTWPP